MEARQKHFFPTFETTYRGGKRQFTTSEVNVGKADVGRELQI